MGTFPCSEHSSLGPGKNLGVWPIVDLSAMTVAPPSFVDSPSASANLRSSSPNGRREDTEGREKIGCFRFSPL